MRVFDYRSKYLFRFYVKAVWTGSELKLNKLGPILNQIGVEDPSSLDAGLSLYYENLNWELNEPLALFGSLTFVIWRREAAASYFSLTPITLDGQIKSWPEVFGSKPDYRLPRLKRFRSKRAGLQIAFLRALKWNSEFGYRIHGGGGLTTEQIIGSLPTYSKRKEMLGRKINFRMKIRRKKLEEY